MAQKITFREIWTFNFKSLSMYLITTWTPWNFNRIDPSVSISWKWTQLLMVKFYIYAKSVDYNPIIKDKNKKKWSNQCELRIICEQNDDQILRCLRDWSWEEKKKRSCDSTRVFRCVLSSKTVTILLMAG